MRARGGRPPCARLVGVVAVDVPARRTRAGRGRPGARTRRCAAQRLSVRLPSRTVPHLGEAADRPREPLRIASTPAMNVAPPRPCPEAGRPSFPSRGRDVAVPCWSPFMTNSPAAPAEAPKSAPCYHSADGQPADRRPTNAAEVASTVDGRQSTGLRTDFALPPATGRRRGTGQSRAAAVSSRVVAAVPPAALRRRGSGGSPTGQKCSSVSNEVEHRGSGCRAAARCRRRSQSVRLRIDEAVPAPGSRSRDDSEW